MKLHPESRWTKPNDWCAHPERWHATDDDSTELEVSELVAAFVRALQPDLVVETGTAWGQTAELIGRALRDNGHGRLVTHEVDQERIDYSLARCDGLPVFIHPASSLDWTPDEPIGFAFFDSLIDLRVPEFLHYKPWLAAGTIVGFHDTAPHHRLHEKLAALDGQIRTIRLRTPRGVTFAEVL